MGQMQRRIFPWGDGVLGDSLPDHKRQCIVQHQEEPRANCTCRGLTMGFEDFIPLPKSI